jgi:tRNA A-37 threonylcarbamoyl transferase component Bud32/tetratricopeptide (TPR) repeat protein
MGVDMGGAPGLASRRPVQRLGERALDRGLLSATQLKQALLEQGREAASGGPARPLGAILVARGFLRREDLDRLLSEQDLEEAELETPGSGTPPAGTPTESSTQTRGKFLLLRQIGRGGMGVVYAALDTQLDRKVALKMLLPKGGPAVLAEIRGEERFLREARLAANLPKHPHIVGIYEAGSVDGTPYISMEYIEGRQLARWRKQPGPSLRAQVGLLRDIALAVDHAHRHGIVHRDLKPANILVDAKNQPHVTDFGLALPVQQPRETGLTIDGMVLGTVTYMSPEQARGQKIDKRTDVYALGVMLYEMLAGRLPFRGETALEVLTQVVRDPVPPPSSVLRPGAPGPVDPALERICLKALAKDVSQRTPSAKAFAEDLARWLRGEEPRAAAPARRSRRGLAAALSAGAALLLVVLAVLLSGPRKPDVSAGLRDARGLAGAGRVEEALAAYERVLQKSQDHAEAADEASRLRAGILRTLDAEAERLLAAGRAREAAAACERALRLDPSNRKALAIQRRAEERLKTDEAAEAAREKTEKEVRELEAKKRRLEEDLQKLARKEAPPPPPPAPPPPKEKPGPALPEPASFPGHAGGVWAVAFSPDGTRLYSGGEDKDVQVRECPGGRVLGRWAGHSGTVLDLAVSPDGRTLVSAGRDSTVRVWDAEASSERRVLASHTAQILCVAFSPDGRSFASTSVDGRVILWETAGGRELQSLAGHAGGAIGAAWSPDGRTLATTSAQGDTALWDASTGRKTGTLPTGGSARLLFLKGGEVLAVADMDEPVVRLWDLASRSPRAVLEGHAKRVRGLAASADGRLLATSSEEGGILLWDASGGKLLGRTAAGGSWAWGLAFASDGRRLAGACADRSVRVWDLSSLR